MRVRRQDCNMSVGVPRAEVTIFPAATGTVTRRAAVLAEAEKLISEFGVYAYAQADERVREGLNHRNLEQSAFFAAVAAALRHDYRAGGWAESETAL